MEPIAQHGSFRGPSETPRRSAKIYWHGFSFPRAKAKADGIFDVALRVFAAADEEGVSPAVAADRLAEERIRSVGRLATIRLPR